VLEDSPYLYSGVGGFRCSLFSLILYRTSYLLWVGGICWVKRLFRWLVSGVSHTLFMLSLSLLVLVVTNDQSLFITIWDPLGQNCLRATSL
jgi:hypothetical protein